MEKNELIAASLILFGASLKSVSAAAIYYGYVGKIVGGAIMGVGMASVYGGAFFLGRSVQKKINENEVSVEISNFLNRRQSI